MRKRRRDSGRYKRKYQKGWPHNSCRSSSPKKSFCGRGRTRNQRAGRIQGRFWTYSCWREKRQLGEDGSNRTAFYAAIQWKAGEEAADMSPGAIREEAGQEMKADTRQVKTEGTPKDLMRATTMAERIVQTRQQTADVPMEEEEGRVPEAAKESVSEAAAVPETEGLSSGDTSTSATDPAIMAALEAILFAMGDAVEVTAIAKALDCSKEEVMQAATALGQRYDAGGSGLMLQHFDDALQLSTRPEQYQNLIRIAKVPKKVTLSDAVIETLSIIAYRQPVTKAEIEQIRGVSCDYAINRLLDYNLIQETGRKDAPGRPILFGTTQQFLRTFGVQKLSDLPQISSAAKEEFQEEAEAEVDSRLNV